MTSVKDKALARANKQEEVPEAVSSVTYTLNTPNGFPILFTMRGPSEADVLGRMNKLEKHLLDNGYTAQIRKGTQKPTQYTGDKCPKCGGQVLDKEKLIHCENYKYDYTAKKNVGTCDYMQWKESKSDEPATQSQIDLIYKLDPNKATMDMTKSEANKYISEHLEAQGK